MFVHVENLLVGDGPKDLAQNLGLKPGSDYMPATKSGQASHQVCN
jgi:hypothetical protein